jgi:hypothetical protein
MLLDKLVLLDTLTTKPLHLQGLADKLFAYYTIEGRIWKTQKHASIDSGPPGFRHLIGMRVMELAADHAVMEILVRRSRTGCIFTELFPRCS